MSHSEGSEREEIRRNSLNRSIREVNAIFDIVSRIMRFIFGPVVMPFTLKLVQDSGSSLDERLKKLDIARESLQESLAAIEDLKEEANKNKRELEDAFYRLEKLEKEKESVENELQEIRKIANVDAQTFRNLVGIPSEDDVFRERIIGLVTGIMASLLAAGFIAFLAWLI